LKFFKLWKKQYSTTWKFGRINGHHVDKLLELHKELGQLFNEFNTKRQMERLSNVVPSSVFNFSHNGVNMGTLSAMDVSQPTLVDSTLQIWTTWKEIMEILNKKIVTDEEIREVDKHIKDFINSFNVLVADSPNSWTPYLHILGAHCVEQLKVFHSLQLVSQEGFENLHQSQKVTYFNLTDRGAFNKDGTFQLLFNSIKIKILKNVETMDQLKSYFPNLRYYLLPFDFNSNFSNTTNQTERFQKISLLLL